MRLKPAANSPLTPELRQFIDRAVVPALVREYIVDLDSEEEKTHPSNGLAEKGNRIAHSTRRCSRTTEE